MTIEKTNGWGADMEQELRPGVPMEQKPRPAGNAHWKQPEQQPPMPGLTRRAQLDELTPVFGSCQPPRGISGLLRHAAYRIPEHHTTHWLMLMGADRVEWWGRRLRKALMLAIPAFGVWTVMRRREA